MGEIGTGIAAIGTMGEELTKKELAFDMLSKEASEKLKKQVKDFISVAMVELKKKYNSDDPKAVSKRLTLLAQLLPSISVAGAISTKAYYKRKSELMTQHVANPETKKLGVLMIKDMAKDQCYDEMALMELTKSVREDLKEEIGALRTQLSYYREELSLKLGKHQG
jgi:hypothetical protein